MKMYLHLAEDFVKKTKGENLKGALSILEEKGASKIEYVAMPKGYPICYRFEIPTLNGDILEKITEIQGVSLAEPFKKNSKGGK